MQSNDVPMFVVSLPDMGSHWVSSDVLSNAMAYGMPFDGITLEYAE